MLAPIRAAQPRPTGGPEELLGAGHVNCGASIQFSKYWPRAQSFPLLWAEAEPFAFSFLINSLANKCCSSDSDVCVCLCHTVRNWHCVIILYVYVHLLHSQSTSHCTCYTQPGIYKHRLRMYMVRYSVTMPPPFRDILRSSQFGREIPLMCPSFGATPTDWYHRGAAGGREREKRKPIAHRRLINYALFLPADNERAGFPSQRGARSRSFRRTFVRSRSGLIGR